MPDDTIAEIHDEHGVWWVYPDGRVTVFSRDGDVITSDPGGPDTVLHPDGSVSIFHDGVITHEFPEGTKYTWSTRDERWISFNREVDGSRWERHPETGQLVERETPHSERPQGYWATADGRTVVTEINHHLFRMQDGHYAIRYNSDLPDRSPLAGQWYQVTEQAWRSVLANNQALEAGHRDPEVAKSAAATDAAFGLLRTAMQVYVDIFIEVGGVVGGPVGRAMANTYEGLKLQEDLRHADSLQDIASVIVDNYNPVDPGNLAAAVVGRSVSRRLDHLGKVDAPDMPHTPRSTVRQTIPDSDAPGTGRHPTDGPAAQPVRDAPVNAPATNAPEAARAPDVDSRPDSTAPPHAQGPSAAPTPAASQTDRGIPANPFEPKPLTTSKDDSLSGARPAEPSAPGTTERPLAGPYEGAKGPVWDQGPTVRVKEERLPEDLEGLTVAQSPNQRTSASNEHYEILAAGLGPPPGLREHWSPHHIVPTREGGPALDDLRHRMEAAGIKPDDPRNGVWLPINDSVPNPTTAVPHGTWLHAGKAPTKARDILEIGDSAGSRADLSYTIWKRTEGKHDEALRVELAQIKAEMNGDSGKVFELYPAPNGWKDAMKPHDVPGPTGLDSQGTGGPSTGGQGGRSETKGAAATATDADRSSEFGKHAAGGEPQAEGAARATQQVPVVRVGGEMAPAPAPVGAGANTAGDRSAIRQDGGGQATPQGPGADTQHHSGAPAQVAAAHGHGGTLHPDPAGPDSVGTAAGNGPGGGIGGATDAPDPLAHPLLPEPAQPALAHGVGLPDQHVHPADPLDGAGAFAGALIKPAHHGVGLPGDPIASLAPIDSHAAVGLPGSAAQDPHAPGARNPNEPDKKAEPVHQFEPQPERYIPPPPLPWHPPPPEPHFTRPPQHPHEQDHERMVTKTPDPGGVP